MFGRGKGKGSNAAKKDSGEVGFQPTDKTKLAGKTPPAANTVGSVATDTLEPTPDYAAIRAVQNKLEKETAEAQYAVLITRVKEIAAELLPLTTAREEAQQRILDELVTDDWRPSAHIHLTSEDKPPVHDMDKHLFYQTGNSSGDSKKARLIERDFTTLTPRQKLQVVFAEYPDLRENVHELTREVSQLDRKIDPLYVEYTTKVDEAVQAAAWVQENDGSFDHDELWIAKFDPNLGPLKQNENPVYLAM